ncbi:MAG: hypothetical protein LBI53_07535 [Candidatus Peribacteria bacterium]|nr:hypothetical protein [Candidatus Peribacteria bacterium]
MYDKLSDPGTLCTSSCKGTDFNTSHPKELRFCVKTFYVSPNAKRGSSELCGMLTNFLE